MQDILFSLTGTGVVTAWLVIHTVGARVILRWSIGLLKRSLRVLLSDLRRASEAIETFEKRETTSARLAKYGEAID